MGLSIENIIKRSHSFDQNDTESIKTKGVVFTNTSICNKIIDEVNPQICEKVCEPSVGKGSFIFTLLERFRENHSILEIIFFIENNLFCFDINQYFIHEFKELLNEYVNTLGYYNDLNLGNIKCIDYLSQSDKFDVTIGNPPYVRIQNLDKKYLNSLKGDLKSMTLGNVDLYYAFLEKSIKSSNRVGFIIPNSFIKTKSGKFLRTIMKDSVNYIYDYCSDLVWDKIKTYTCIIICDNENTDIVNYQTKNVNILKKKSELCDNDGWIFSNMKIGENKLYDMVHYSTGGLATLKDSVYKMDYIDGDYCIKGGYKIEKELCNKVIKATKSRSIKDHSWMIYPYIDDVIMGEEYISENFPYGYKYLLDNKKVLLSRDKGKTEKYDSWYAYGRKQGLIKESKGKVIILPLNFLKSKGVHYIDIPVGEKYLVLSGIQVDIKEDKFNDFIKEISTDRFNEYCEYNNKTLRDKKGSTDIFLGLTAVTLKKFKY